MKLSELPDKTKTVYKDKYTTYRYYSTPVISKEFNSDSTIMDVINWIDEVLEKIKIGL